MWTNIATDIHTPLVEAAGYYKHHHDFTGNSIYFNSSLSSELDLVSKQRGLGQYLSLLRTDLIKAVHFVDVIMQYAMGEGAHFFVD